MGGIFILISVVTVPLMIFNMLGGLVGGVWRFVPKNNQTASSEFPWATIIQQKLLAEDEGCKRQPRPKNQTAKSQFFQLTR